MENDNMDDKADETATDDKSENKDSSKDVDLDQEIDAILSKKQDDTESNEIDEYEETTITKKELSELRKKAESGENFKRGLLSVKDKFKKIKQGIQKPAENKEDKPDSSEDRPLKVSDLYRINTNRALTQLKSEDPTIEKHWQSIVKYYRPTHGKDSVEGVIKDIKQAKLLFLDENPEMEEKSNNKDIESKIGSDGGKSSGQSNKGEDDGETKKKSIIPKQTPVKDWYK